VHESFTIGEINSSEFFNHPILSSLTQPLSNSAVSALVGTNVECGSIDIDRESGFRHSEIGN
jgi:hypothetical protein